MGDMAGKDGKFVIQNLPAGTYDVRATNIGYAPYTYQGVHINVDLTTELRFPLEVAVVHGPAEVMKTCPFQAALQSAVVFIPGAAA